MYVLRIFTSSLCIAGNSLLTQKLHVPTSDVHIIRNNLTVHVLLCRLPCHL